MSSAPNVDAFKGTDWEECNTFIRALRLRALWEGKQRDPAWVADFAAPHFSHKALLWHSRLPQDVRQDWFKLETALLERWAPPEGDEGETIVPTPAAAPSINRIKTAERQLRMVLKVVTNESNKSYFVQFDGLMFCDLTKDAADALHIRCNSVSSATLLETTDGPYHSWLAIQWRALTPKLGAGSEPEFAHIPVVDSESLKSSWANHTSWQLMNCNVLISGEVIPFWRDSDGGNIALTPFVAGRALVLVMDPIAYSREYPDEKRAKLFVETAD